MSDMYKFNFDATNTSVLQMFEVDKRKLKAEKLTNSTFEVETGVNDLGIDDVVSVTRTKQSKGFVETTVFTDQDGNDLFVEDFEIEVATTLSPAFKLEKHQFSFDTLGNITADLELGKRGWKADRIDANEDYAQITLNGTDYVVKTETERKGIEFEIFRDDNQDGIWTQIAEGETQDLFIDAITGSVDLVGIQSLLDASIGIVG